MNRRKHFAACTLSHKAFFSQNRGIIYDKFPGQARALELVAINTKDELLEGSHVLLLLLLLQVLALLLGS